MSEPLSVVHLITGLEAGGAERMLVDLVGAFDPGRISCTVVSLLPLGPLAAIISPETPVATAAMVRPENPRAWWRLVSAVRSARPAVVHSWLQKADLVAAAISPLVGRPSLVWGLHVSPPSPDASLGERAVHRGTAWSSRWLPDVVTCVSDEAAEAQIAAGYDRDRLVVVSNAFDASRFQPDVEARRLVRTELGLAAQETLVGLVARHHPVKDHLGFLNAMVRVRNERPDAHILLVGDGTEPGSALEAEVSRLDLARSTSMLGRRFDVPRLTAALDVAVSSSRSEAFSSVLGEAMACEVPVVATAVGNAVDLLRGIGRTIPPGNPLALARAIVDELSADPVERQDRVLRGRRRIVDNYSLESVAERHSVLYEQLAAQ